MTGWGYCPATTSRSFWKWQAETQMEPITGIVFVYISHVPRPFCIFPSSAFPSCVEYHVSDCCVSLYLHCHLLSFFTCRPDLTSAWHVKLQWKGNLRRKNRRSFCAPAATRGCLTTHVEGPPGHSGNDEAMPQKCREGWRPSPQTRNGFTTICH